MKKLLIQFCAVIAALTVTTVSALADNVYWNIADGDWQTDAHWDTGKAPTNADFSYVNNSGTATLSSGAIDVGRIYLGQTAGASGNLNVSGYASVQTNYMLIGVNGLGVLTLSDHASWVNTYTANGGVVISSANSGTGIVNLTDYTSLQAAGSIHLGNTLANTGHGILNVSGHASVTANNYFYLKNDAILNLADSASVTVLGDGGIWFYNGANATVNITGDQVRVLSTNGIDADFAGSGGNGTVNFNHGGNLVFANKLTGGVLAVNVLSGTTTLTGDNTYARGTTVSAGAVLVADSLTALGAGDVSVSAGGVLALGEHVTELQLGGDVTIHGLLSLNLGQTLTISGDLLLDGDLSLTVSTFADLAALNLADFLTVSGATGWDNLNILATDGLDLWQGTLGAGGALTFEPANIPEPSTWALLLSGGVVALMLSGRKVTAASRRRLAPTAQSHNSPAQSAATGWVGIKRHGQGLKDRRMVTGECAGLTALNLLTDMAPSPSLRFGLGCYADAPSALTAARRRRYPAAHRRTTL